MYDIYIIVDKTLRTLGVSIRILFTIGENFNMGGTCSSIQLGGDVHIPGNGNSAIIFNGVSYNILSIFNSAVNLIVQKYRFESIIIQFTSIGLSTISLCLLILSCIEKNSKNKWVMTLHMNKNLWIYLFSLDIQHISDKVIKSF